MLRDVAEVYEAVVEDAGGTWKSDFDGSGARRHLGRP